MGIALVLRNALQQVAGRGWILAAIMIGALLSAQVAPQALTIASATSFFFSEMSDWAVYSPLKKRNMAFAIMAAGITGSVVDSALFVTLAFGGRLDLITGQVVAKLWATVFAACLIGLTRHKTPAP